MNLSLQFIDGAPIPSPEANPEPCIEIIFRVLQLFLTTTSRPRRREYTTPEEDDDPETEPTTESSTDTQPTEGNGSGESADGPSIDDGTNADSPSTTEGNPDDTPNEIVPRNEDTIRRLTRIKPKPKTQKPKSKQNDWWFGGIKW